MDPALKVPSNLATGIFQWAEDSIHVMGAPSPQLDANGNIHDAIPLPSEHNRLRTAHRCAGMRGCAGNSLLQDCNKRGANWCGWKVLALRDSLWTAPYSARLSGHKWLGSRIEWRSGEMALAFDISHRQRVGSSIPPHHQLNPNRHRMLGNEDCRIQPNIQPTTMGQVGQHYRERHHVA